MGLRSVARRSANRPGVVHAVPDEEVLVLLETGVYKICPETAVLTNGKGRVIAPWDFDGYLFVRLYSGGRCRSIHLGKLVWMSVTKCVVPAGWEVHHVDGDTRNNHWENVECLHELDHKKKHRSSAEVPF
jgi:hypothetical protein